MPADIKKEVQLEDMQMSMLKLLNITYKLKAADLHLKSGTAPRFRMGDELLPYELAVKAGGTGTTESLPIIPKDKLKELIYSMLSEQRIKVFEAEKELDLSVPTDKCRFRVNIADEKNGYCTTIRVIPKKIREIGDIGFPEGTWENILELQQGLVLITGVTGSGKSTTLASLIQEMNRTQCKKIICIEDPIEYEHPDLNSMIIQRELYVHTLSFSEGVKRSMRQDPDVIMIGEIRDYETMQEALRAAETGHLVFSTLHTGDAAGTVSRLHELAPGNQKDEVGRLLADYLAYVISQKLIPYERGEYRVLAMEVMKNIPRLRSSIVKNDKPAISDQITRGSQFGMVSMDNRLYDLVVDGKIKSQNAIKYAVNKEDLSSRLEKL